MRKSAPASKMEGGFKLCHCGVDCGCKGRNVPVFAVCAASYTVEITAFNVLLELVMGKPILNEEGCADNSLVWCLEQKIF